ncbi:unnamed protein product [Lampetra fluviatilis]
MTKDSAAPHATATKPPAHAAETPPPPDAGAATRGPSGARRSDPVDIPGPRGACWARAAAAAVRSSSSGASQKRRVTFNLDHGGGSGGSGGGFARSPPRSILKLSPPARDDAGWGEGGDASGWRGPWAPRGAGGSAPPPPPCSSEFASAMEELYREGAVGRVC